jgi:RNA polymerase sigma-70 factor (ECF subfamily)
MDDEEHQLLSQAQQGSVEAFGDLYERFAPAVFRYLFSQLDSRQDAEDLTADVFFRVWQALPRYNQRGVPFLAYLFKVARNVRIDFYRRTAFARLTNHTERDDEISLVDSGPAELMQSRQDHQEIRKILDGLRSEYRLVLILRFVEGMDVEAAARLMQRSPGAVRVLTHRALAALRARLEAQRSSDEG